jgi:fluoroacetyl-CoA thioesterase
MKNIFIPGDQKKYKKTVGPTDVAAFHGVTLHEVCSTFSLARDFEWSSRLFFIDMKEEDEEGVGTFLSIDHKSPAFVGEEIIFTAQVVKIEKNELICSIEAKTAGRLIATGTTGQKMLKKDRLKQIFTKPS